MGMHDQTAGSVSGDALSIGATSAAGSDSGMGADSGSGAGSGAAGAACTGRSSGTSHSQQSLHRLHFGHRWLAQVSLVHHTQMRVDSSPQMLQLNGMLLFLRLGSGVGLLGQNPTAALRFVIHDGAFLLVRGRQIQNVALEAFAIRAVLGHLAV